MQCRDMRRSVFIRLNSAKQVQRHKKYSYPEPSEPSTHSGSFNPLQSILNFCSYFFLLSLLQTVSYCYITGNLTTVPVIGTFSFLRKQTSQRTWLRVYQSPQGVHICVTCLVPLASSQTLSLFLSPFVSLLTYCKTHFQSRSHCLCFTVLLIVTSYCLPERAQLMFSEQTHSLSNALKSYELQGFKAELVIMSNI